MAVVRKWWRWHGEKAPHGLARGDGAKAAATYRRIGEAEGDEALEELGDEATCCSYTWWRMPLLRSAPSNQGMRRWLFCLSVVVSLVVGLAVVVLAAGKLRLGFVREDDRLDRIFDIPTNRSGSLFRHITSRPAVPEDPLAYIDTLRASNHKPHTNTSEERLEINPYTSAAAHNGGRNKTMPQRCRGPRGNYLPNIRAYRAPSDNHPHLAFGSYELLELDQTCSTYAQRFEPYMDESAEDDWAGAMEECFELNRDFVGARKAAVALRLYDEFQFTYDNTLNILAMISELVINSGGMYDVKLLWEAKGETSVLSSQEERDKALQKVPKGLRGLVEFWTEDLVQAMYPFPDAPLNRGYAANGRYRGCFMSVQIFSHNHPEYDYVYNWEPDIRSTANYYLLFRKFEKFARKQDTVDVTVSDDEDPFVGYHVPHYSPWNGNAYGGDGREADHIALGPMIEADRSSWLWRDDVIGIAGTDTRRRSAIVAVGRMSRRLLQQMSDLNARQEGFFCEMLPPSVARFSTQYNEYYRATHPEAADTVRIGRQLKAVSIPQPMYLGKVWPPNMREAMYNDAHMHRIEMPLLGQSSFYYNAGYAQKLYEEWRQSETGICWKPLLIHPVKGITDPEKDAELAEPAAP